MNTKELNQVSKALCKFQNVCNSHQSRKMAEASKHRICQGGEKYRQISKISIDPGRMLQRNEAKFM